MGTCKKFEYLKQNTTKEMLLKIFHRNALECTTFISCLGTFICVLLNYTTNISPIYGVWFPLYVLILFILSLYASFKFIQWLLSLNKPLKYDLEKISVDYPYLSFLPQVLTQISSQKCSNVKDECIEYDTNELSVISTVLERRLVSSWYVPYVSQEIGFPFACKQLLDQMIGKTFQICNKIETKDIFVDTCTILSSHLKEYQKAVIRHEKSPSSSIESLYKKSHPVFDSASKKLQPADHCTNILRIILKELIPWELWDTPHSELLVRILSKKLNNFIDTTLTEPAWLNYKLLTVLKGKKEIKIEELDVTNTVELETEIKPDVLVEESESVLTQNVVEKEAECKEECLRIENIVEELPVTSSDPVDIKSSPVLRQRRGRQGRNEVKIYDRVIEGSVKTWETDMDLQCISLGQDLLASLDGEITLSRLWGQEPDADGSPNPPQSKSPQPLWFGEEETIEVDPIDTSPREVKKEHNPKPAELLKDLQTTVSQAKHKIGDLQVENNVLHVSRNQSSDEAAGMMEGLLDFGIAGLKKGLRLTGLSDDSQEKSPSHHKEKPGDKNSPTSTEMKFKQIPEHRDVNITATIRDESGVPPLLKQQRVISQDSVPSQPKPIPKADVPIPLSDSPEPEYEEAADLTTSIAKLRCLLQQRAEATPKAGGRTEEVWWEGAEETTGRSQHHPSFRPVDTATLADEYDMNMDRNSPTQTSNNMQRLDKLFQRTVTGVFNSLRVAVGADEQSPRTLTDWEYVCTSPENTVSVCVSRLVGARRGYSQVEAALDSLHQLDTHETPRPHTPDDFEEWAASRGVCSSAVSAALAASGLVQAHVAHRLAALLFADLAESLLESWLEDFSTWLRRQVFAIFEEMAEETSSTQTRVLPEVNVEDTCEAIMEKIPSVAYAFGIDTVSSSVQLVVSSLSHQQINKDVTFRLLDILTGHFKKSAALRNPSFDNN